MTMFLVGGGPSDGLGNVHDQFVAAAKKRGTRVAIALLGAQDEVGELLTGYAEPIRARWPEVEIVPVWLDDEPEDGVDATEWPADFDQVAALVVAGGWAPGYLEALRPRRDLIATLVRRGTPYLGYSAGAMVVGKRAIVGGTRFRGRQMVPEVWGEGLDELELRDGLALIGPSVDVHSDVSSLGRAMAAVEKGEVATVVAIDEDTCLVVDPVSGHTVVEGTQRIHWVQGDARGMSIQHDSSAAERERHQGFLDAERQAAEAEAAARRAAAEQEAARRQAEAEEAARLQAEREAAAAEPAVEVPAEVVAEPTEEAPTGGAALEQASPAGEGATVVDAEAAAPEPTAVGASATEGAKETALEGAVPAEVAPPAPEAAAPQPSDGGRPEQQPTEQQHPEQQETEQHGEQDQPDRSAAVAAAEAAANQAAALEGEPVPDEFGQLYGEDFAAEEPHPHATEQHPDDGVPQAPQE